MATGSYYFYGNGEKHNMWVLMEWEATPNPTANTSKVTIKMSAVLGKDTEASYVGGSWFTNAGVKYGWTDGATDWATKETFFFKGKNNTAPILMDATMGHSQWLEFGSCTFTAPHNALGQCYLKFVGELNSPTGSTAGSIVFGDEVIPTEPHMELPAIDRVCKITSAAGFTDEESPWVRFTNPLGLFDIKVRLGVGYNDSLVERTLSKTAKSHTFVLTEAERNLLRSKVTSGSSVSIRYSVITIENGTVINTSGAWRVMNLSDALPIITNYGVADMRTETTELTGDLSTLVRYESIAATSIAAVGQKGATIKTLAIMNGDVVKDYTPAAFYNVIAPEFIFQATDNRGNSSTVTKTVNFIEYVKPTCNQELEMELSGETGAVVAVTISGNYFNGSFGAQRNSLKLEVRHTQNDGTMGDWVEVTAWADPTFKENTYTVDFNVSGLQYDRAYTFQCRATDALNVVSTTEHTVSIIPVFDWSETDFNFNVPIQMNGETVLRHNKSANNLVVSASGGHIYIRPAGTNSTYAEIKITPQGNIELNGDIIINGTSLKNKLSIT